MSETETIVIDVYPWPEPSAEQMDMFDRLSPEEQREMIDEAIEEGFSSGLSTRSVRAIIEDEKG